ncbi:hypothetical protein C1H46_011853 [Malus baccata]|uniref:Uncharacterized protein n=1 Tax=Malus baccata TaxID=106549 RepID=A0A540MUS3_MALBA|nr:hypothetical protein C1H46_011853 [Malus baccata]
MAPQLITSDCSSASYSAHMGSKPQLRSRLRGRVPLSHCPLFHNLPNDSIVLVATNRLHHPPRSHHPRLASWRPNQPSWRERRQKDSPYQAEEQEDPGHLSGPKDKPDHSDHPSLDPKCLPPNYRRTCANVNSLLTHDCRALILSKCPMDADSWISHQQQVRDAMHSRLSHPDVPVEELTLDLRVSLQVLMDRVGQMKDKEIRSLGAGWVREVESCSSSSSTATTETDSRLQHMEEELARQRELIRQYFMVVSQSISAYGITIPPLLS